MYRIVSLMAAEHRNSMILGDPDQSICAYRGATSEENFASFTRDFPGHDVVTLERNYRSTKAILRAANAVIEQNRGRHQKHLWTDGPAGEPLVIEDCENEFDEADRIASWTHARLRPGVQAQGAVCARARQRARRRHRAGAHGRSHPGARHRDDRIHRTRRQPEERRLAFTPLDHTRVVTAPAPPRGMRT
jgi:DNA helicase-2/ATP-dependent DNA helicase PcrA